MTSEKWQLLRNRIYAIIGLVAVVLVTLGIIDQASADEGISIASMVLNLAGEGISIAGLCMAWWKTRLSANTTLSIPSADVLAVVENTSLGVITTAGPGSSETTGVLLPTDSL